MSEFPQTGSFSTRISEAHIDFLKDTSFDKSLPIVIKKEKKQYLYDLDGNKYSDFYLNNGTVICGHNNPLLTPYIKDGISAGTSTLFLNRFYHSLSKVFKKVLLFDFISFYNSVHTALIALINTIKPERIGVNTGYLLELMQGLFPFSTIEKADHKKEYSMIIFEPLDFDGDLSEFDYSQCRAEWKCAFESRTAFRLKKGFIRSLKEIPVILSSNNIANGMDSAVMFSKNPLPGENIPAYKALAVLETIKYYLRKPFVTAEGCKIKSRAAPFQNKSIFKLKRYYNPAELLKYGVMVRGDTGFLCTEHTEYDIKRLERALEAGQ